MVLRDFLYLDRRLVRDFLAQLEGGVFDESKEKRLVSGKKGIEGKVGAGPIAMGGNKGSENSIETEAVMRQVAASEFSRLYDHLDTEDLTLIESFANKSEAESLKRKQLIEADARFKLSGSSQLIDLIGKFGALAPLMEQFGTNTAVEDDTLKGMQALGALGETENMLPVIATIPGGANVKIALELDPKYALSDTWDIEATVLFRVQRILKENESYIVGDPFGGLMKLMPEKDRAAFTDSLATEDMAKLGIGEVEIKAPAVIGTAIAIYR